MADYAEALSTRPKRPGKKELDHIRLSKAENGGHMVEHHFVSEHGFHEPETHVFGDGKGKELMAHVAEHMGVKMEHGDGKGEK